MASCSKQEVRFTGCEYTCKYLRDKPFYTNVIIQFYVRPGPSGVFSCFTAEEPEAEEEKQGPE